MDKFRDAECLEKIKKVLRKKLRDSPHRVHAKAGKYKETYAR
jgi:hypothetical protein